FRLSFRFLLRNSHSLGDRSPHPRVSPSPRPRVRSLRLSELVVLANQAADHSLNLNSFGGLNEDWFELWIGGFEPDEFGLAVEFLHGGIISIDKRHYDLTVLGGLL